MMNFIFDFDGTLMDTAPVILSTMQATINELGWDSADTLVIGDADVDINMGKGAGCLTCAVTYGNGLPESL